MRKAIFALMLLAAACTPGTTTVTPQVVIDWIASNCGAIVVAADIAAALVAVNPADAAAFGKQVCDAIQAQRSGQLKSLAPGEKPPTGGVVEVNGVPIHYQVQ